ncbi:LysR family transcriptional regulator [Chitinibacter bivalviorum]|uniref:LysR family transcriptional regulator n=1 Tax=Chitinibacter bivalviorum TaxID=2739434 RepID=A0A7H9BGU7_9NEIS|nr:LysR family transcriptional regulator [Chitinibacter bivalviorum]QLG87943.1 LysR family transcriptional regulator [Chitinibacter bivalviorum]
MKTILDPESLLAFEALSRLGSFTAAAQDRGCAKSHISQLIRELEKELATVLVLRSTRSMTLTEAGQKLLPHAVALRELLGQVRLDIEDTQQHIEGELWISTTPSLSQYVVGPLMAELAKLHPGLRIRVDSNNRLISPGADGVDFCIRVGRVGDERLVAKELGYAHDKLFAAPSYLAQAPALNHPSDLIHHASLINDDYQYTRQWHLVNGSEEVKAALNPLLCSDTNPTLAISAINGYGIALLPQFVGETYCKFGLLEPILSDWSANPTPVFLVYPFRSAMPRKHRVFIDFIVEALRERLTSKAD